MLVRVRSTPDTMPDTAHAQTSTLAERDVTC